MNSLNFPKLIDSGQLAAIALLGVAAFTGVVTSTLAFAGILPWPQLSLSYGGEVIAWSGMALQIGMTLLLVLVALFLPSARRVLRLETSHRRFEIDMDDITKAYRAAHMADRAETFAMRREFDAVRERYQFLKTHPDMSEMDTELLTIAAQMSEQTRELAEVYSDTKVSRARDSLLQRRADAKALEERIQQAHADIREVKRLMDDVDIDESSVASQLQQLRDEIAILDGFNPDQGPKPKVPHLKSV